MSNHLKLVTHEHAWEAYTLSDEYGIYYTGYRCECGETGYMVPMKDPSGAEITTRRNDDRQDRH